MVIVSRDCESVAYENKAAEGNREAGKLKATDTRAQPHTEDRVFG